VIDRVRHVRGILDTSAVIALSRLDDRNPDDFRGIDGLDVVAVPIVLR
jgi:hypothetical protein